MHSDAQFAAPRPCRRTSRLMASSMGNNPMVGATARWPWPSRKHEEGLGPVWQGLRGTRGRRGRFLSSREAFEGAWAGKPRGKRCQHGGETHEHERSDRRDVRQWKAAEDCCAAWTGRTAFCARVGGRAVCAIGFRGVDCGLRAVRSRRTGRPLACTADTASVRQMGVEAAQRLRAPVYGAAARPPKDARTAEGGVRLRAGASEAVAQPPRRLRNRVPGMSPGRILYAPARKLRRAGGRSDHATWCMLTHEAEIRHIDGDVWKTLAGGDTYFIVERRMRDREGRLVLSGYIPPKNLLVRPPLLPARGGREGFLGISREPVTPPIGALRRFYECAAKSSVCARRSSARMARSAASGAAVAATRAFREKAAAFEKLPGGPQTLSDDERRTWSTN